MSMADLRREYTMAGLREEDCEPDPVRQFAKWFGEWLAASPIEPNAATLATSAADGRPSARVVLLKGFDETGFVFFTNYQSRKGRELSANPLAALCLFWPDFERQVRIEGSVEKLSDEESDAYHRTRPRASQLGAWCSFQSDAIAGREVLEQRLRELQERFGEGEIPRPPGWGGYRLKHDAVEFWQGRPSRLHDRIRYRPAAGAWIFERLSP